MAKASVYSKSTEYDIAAYNYVEISIDPHVLNNFANEDGIGAFLVSHACSEEFQKLKVDLVKEIVYIIENCLTKKQREVMKMTYLEGKTQNEISGELKKHQTTIHKILQGNIDYNNDGKRYGGALKKIKKICLSSDRVQEILRKMKEYYSEEAQI